MLKGDQVFVKSPMESPSNNRGNINGKLGIDKTGMATTQRIMHIPITYKRPGAAVEHQQVQKPAGGSGSNEHQRVGEWPHPCFLPFPPDRFPLGKGHRSGYRLFHSD